MDNHSNLSKAQLASLTAPLNPNRVHQKQGQSHVQAWDIKAHLIRTFGYGGFSAEVVESSIVAVREHPMAPGHVKSDGSPKTPQVIAKATVRLTIFGIGPDGQDAIYTESAIGANSGWDIGDTMDNSVKTAESQALKRCAIYLGTQFGLSLYQNGSTQDIVRVMFNETQRQMILQGQAEMYAQPGQPTAQSSVQDALDRATSEPVAEESPEPMTGDYA
jgi:hypothetical protein